MTLREVTAALGGRLIGGQTAQIIKGITTRPKFASATMAMVMLRPHPRAEIVAAVRRRTPIIATLVQARSLPADAVIIAVRSPRAAYQDFARAYRFRLGIPVIAITGTAGKTTTKDMLRSILGRTRQVIATAANYNANPAFTILSADASTDAIILEMGMDRRGQIASQCRLAAPDVGIITNVGRAHLEHCGGFAGVIRAKNEMVHGIKRGGTLVLNADDAGSKRLDTSRFVGRILRVGRAAGADFRLVDARPTSPGVAFTVAAEGRLHALAINVSGEHLVYDALAATAAARAVGASWDDIRLGLARHSAASGRLTYRRSANGAVVIDDSYNANPLSVVAAIRTLCEIAAGKRTIAVLGNMEEQGSAWKESHRQVGAAAAKAGVNCLVTVGNKAAQIRAGAVAAGLASSRIHRCRTNARATAIARRLLSPDSVVLVKGSHSTGMYKIARALARKGQGRGQVAPDIGGCP